MAAMNTEDSSPLVLNPILAFTQGSERATQRTDHPCLIHWDLRSWSVDARLYGNSDSPLTFGHLRSTATDPKVSALNITCGILQWPIEVRRPYGPVAVNDVLEAIRGVLLKRISRSEWDTYSKNQQDRINAAFIERWKAAEDPIATRENGILRLDCLLQHTIFAGLSVSLDTPNTCILTLRRRQQARN